MFHINNQLEKVDKSGGNYSFYREASIDILCAINANENKR